MDVGFLSNALSVSIRPVFWVHISDSSKFFPEWLWEFLLTVGDTTYAQNGWAGGPQKAAASKQKSHENQYILSVHSICSQLHKQKDISNS